MRRVRADHQRFWLPKAGHTAAEYEDASAGPSWDEGGALYAAVADGATESAFAGVWARALCTAWTEGPDGAIDRARERFEKEVDRQAEDLPWYAQAKRREGAFATVLGLRVAPDGTWFAQVVGDCILLCIEEGTLVYAWPFEDAADFDNSPDLLCSNPDWPAIGHRQLNGEWGQGSTFVLASDALAAYLLANDPIDILRLETDAAFAAFVAQARQDGMRNDDVTALILRLY